MVKGKKAADTVEERLAQALVPETEWPYEVPENWVWVRLGTVIEFAENCNIHSEYDGEQLINYLDIEGIDNDNHTVENVKRLPVSQLSSRARRVLKKGFLTYSLVRPYLNNLAIIEDEREHYIGTTGFAVFKPRFGDVKLYFHYMLTHEIKELYLGYIKGFNSPSITLEQFKMTSFPLPPLPEQHRIIARLESLLGKLKEARQLIAEARESFELRRAALLHQAFSGELTEKWRGENPNVETATNLINSIHLEKTSKYEGSLPKGKRLPNKVAVQSNIESKYDRLFSEIPLSWKVTYFTEMTADKKHAIKAGPFGSALKKEFYRKTGHKIYGQEQVIKGDPYYGDYFIDLKKFEELRTCEVGCGDLLISLVGTIGKTLILPADCERGIINPRLVKVSLHNKINSFFVAKYFESNIAKSIMAGDAHGGTMQILNLDILKKLPIPLPPLEEQNEIMRVVGKIESEEAGIMEMVELSDHLALLEKSILSKAFRGELGTGDMADEPALEMLKRVFGEKHN